MASIFITGINGFWGKRLAALLAENGHDVSGIGTTDTSVFRKYWACDIRQKDQVIDIIKKTNPEVIIHLAALASVTSGQVMDYYETNVLGTENVIAGLNALSGRRRIIFSSSAAVYGNQKPQLLKEDARLLPVSHYGMSKFVCERLFTNIMSDHNITIVRPFNLLGPNQPRDFVISKIIHHFMEREPCIRFGNIHTLRDYIDLDSACLMIMLLLGRPCTYSETINLCSGEGISAHDLMHLLTELTDHHISMEVAQEYIRSNEIWSLVGSNEKLKKLLPEAFPLLSIRDNLKKIIGTD